MKLHIVGSSSSGNSYLLQSEKTGEVLAIEAGVKFDKVKQALDFNISRIVGCIVSHEHGDHAMYARAFTAACIPVYTSRGTLQALGVEGAAFTHALQPYKTTLLGWGDFRVIPFPVEHDAKEPFGYLINHPECGTVVFATDTYYLRDRFNDVSNWLIECNYRQDLLDANIAAGRITAARRDRTLKSHMSYETCLETLHANDLSRTNNIVLIHLSSDNSAEQDFVRGIHEATHKNVLAARAGMVIPFNKTPY